jgi:porin
LILKEAEYPVKHFVLGIFFLFRAVITYGQARDTAIQNTVTINSSVVVDNVANLTGGINTGYTTLGLFDFSIEYSPFKDGFLQKTIFYGHILKTGGKGASENFIGDAQVASNIEGRASRLIYELLIKQSFGKINFSLGLHDLNTEFMLSDFAGDLINSSFGIFPAVSLNVPVSVFPVTSFGGIISYNGSMFDIVTGFYNLNHDFTEEQVFEFSNHFFQKGYLGVGEFRFRWLDSNRKLGEYKVGGYYKDCHRMTEEHDEDNCSSEKNYGFYFVGDQVIWSQAYGAKFGVFGQIGLAPKEKNYVPDYYGVGLSLNDLNNKFLPEYFGIAMGKVTLNNFDTDGHLAGSNNETVVELSIKKELFNHFTLHPDIQYIISPSGIYNNAFVGIIRIQIELYQ